MRTAGLACLATELLRMVEKDSSSGVLGCQVPSMMPSAVCRRSSSSFPKGRKRAGGAVLVHGNVGNKSVFVVRFPSVLYSLHTMGCIRTLNSSLVKLMEPTFFPSVVLSYQYDVHVRLQAVDEHFGGRSGLCAGEDVQGGQVQVGSVAYDACFQIEHGGRKVEPAVVFQVTQSLSQGGMMGASMEQSNCAQDSCPPLL